MPHNPLPIKPVPESTSVDVDLTYGTGATIDLKPGMGWAIYADNGPAGPCGQGGRTTCPHTVFHTWPDENAMRRALAEGLGRNKHRATLQLFGVVDEYTSSGLFRVVTHK